MVSLMLLPYLPRAPFHTRRPDLPDAEKRKLAVQPLRITQLIHAQDTALSAFAGSDLLDAVLEPWLPLWLWRPLCLFLWSLYVFDPTKRVRQLDDARAVCLSVMPPAAFPSPTLKRRLVTDFSRAFIGCVDFLAGPEVCRRRASFYPSKHAALHEAFAGTGVDADEAVNVQLIGVSPSLQGHGCGAKLIQDVCDWADARGRYVWLMAASDNVVPFYNKLGFEFKSCANMPSMRVDKDPVEHQIKMPILLRAPRAVTPP